MKRRRRLLSLLLLILTLFYLLIRSRWRRVKEKIVIVGGGIAGLAAAHALRHAADVTILEAQSRVGGRIRTNRSMGFPVELGAVWIHRATHNVISALADEFGCRRFVTENKRIALFDDAGQRVAESEVVESYKRLTQYVMPALLRKRATLLRKRKARLKEPNKDVSLAAVLKPILSAEHQHTQSSKQRRCTLDYLLYRHVVQDHAVGLAKSSAKAYDMDYYGGNGKDELLPHGYDCIVRRMAKGLKIKRGQVASHVRWANASTRVATVDGSVYEADRVIVTVPLGVLKAGLAATSTPPPMGALRFEPPLPVRTQRAVRRLGYAEHAHHVALRFKHAFWPIDVHFVGRVFGGCSRLGSSHHLEFLNVMRYRPEAPVLLLMSTASTARFLTNLTDTATVEWVMARLKEMFPNDCPTMPERYIVHRGETNAFQRGAWSYTPTGAPGVTLRRAFHHTADSSWASTPRLVLAGEHTSELHPGTVHGALVSGRQAAHQLLEAIHHDRISRQWWWLRWWWGGGGAAKGGGGGGAGYLERYLESLLRNIGTDQEEGEDSEFVWDRNP